MTQEQIKSRIIKRPFFHAWENKDIGAIDSYSEDGEYNFKDMFLGEQIVIFVYAWNMSDYGVSRKKLCKQFNLTNYRLTKILKTELKGIVEALPCFSEATGMICGKAYFVNKEKLK